MGPRISTLPASVVLFTLLISGTVSAQVSETRVEVNGMSCPFCAFGVEKKLAAVKGVAEVSIDMKSGRAVLIAVDEESIDVAMVPEAVRKAGFTPGTIEIVVRGILFKEGNGLAIRLSGSQETLALRAIPQPEADEALRLADGAIVVEVAGVWWVTEDDGPAIEVVSIRRVAD